MASSWNLLQNIFLWAFLPNFIASTIQSWYYRLFYASTPSRVPRPNEPRYKSHKRIIYILVIISYLLYSYVEVEQSMPPNFYDILGIQKDFQSKDLRASFRSFSLKYHPDKVAAEERANAEVLFIQYQRAYNTLKDPLTRQAYELLGEETLSCDNCKTMRDYMLDTVLSTFVGFYLGIGVFLFILNILGKGQFGRYWRFVALFGLAALEASMILQASLDPSLITTIPTSQTTNPSSTASSAISESILNATSPTSVFSFTTILAKILDILYPRRTTHEKIAILRQIITLFFLALSQIGPNLFPEENRDLKNVIGALDFFVKVKARESKETLRQLLEPFRGDDVTVTELKRNVQRVLIETIDRGVDEPQGDGGEVNTTSMNGPDANNENGSAPNLANIQSATSAVGTTASAASRVGLARRVNPKKQRG